jgi:protein TonB
MSVRLNEKKIIYLLILSLLFHAGIVVLIAYLPEKKKTPPREAYMVELRDLNLPTKRPAEESNPVQEPSTLQRSAKSPLPAGRTPRPELPAAVPATPSQAPARPEEKGEVRETPKRSPTPALPTGESIIRRRQEALPGLAKLFPTGKNLASIEDAYRKKYGESLGGNRVFLGQNSETIGSYEKRLIAAVNSNWKIVGRRMLSNGDTGYGLLLITIARDGTVEQVKVVESSGNRQVDDSVVEAVRTAGYVGPLPKKWPYDKLEGYYTYMAEHGPY